MTGQVPRMVTTSTQQMSPDSVQLSSLPRRKGWLFMPVLASLLQDRWSALLLVGIAALQVVLVALGAGGWRCPVKAVLGIPCPGCGLSHAVVLLLRGEWGAALSTHAFAPVFLCASILVVVVSVLPNSWHRGVVSWIAVSERRTGVVTFLLLGLIVYWGFRLFGLV